jgi:hypothetical protein
MNARTNSSIFEDSFACALESQWSKTHVQLKNMLQWNSSTHKRSFDELSENRNQIRIFPTAQSVLVVSKLQLSGFCTRTHARECLIGTKQSNAKN